MPHLAVIQSPANQQSNVLPLVQDVIDSMPSNTALLDGTGTIIATNDKWKQFARNNGLRHVDACIGQNYLDTCKNSSQTEPTAVLTLNGIRDVLCGISDKFEIEYPCHSPTEQRWFMMTVTPIKCAGTARAILSHHNISSRVSAEHTVRQQHAYLDTILETAPDAIIAFEPNGRIRSLNPAANAIFDVDNFVRPVKTLFELIPEFELSMLETHSSMEIKLQNKGGAKFVELAINKFESDEDPLWIAGIRDITERKQFEQRLENFFLMVSHDLRSPLAAVTGSLSLVTEGVVGKLSDDAQELLWNARQSSDQMMRLIDDFLDFKKIQANRLQLNPQRVTAKSLLLNAKQKLNALAVQANLNVIVQDDDLNVICDAGAIAQVLTNLLSNALKFTPSGKRIVLSAKLNGTRCQISVADEGRGVPPEQRDRLFEPFESGTTPEQAFVASSGLGLALVKSLLDLHQSTITVEPGCPIGTIFSFNLPIAPAAGN